MKRLIIFFLIIWITAPFVYAETLQEKRHRCTIGCTLDMVIDEMKECTQKELDCFFEEGKEDINKDYEEGKEDINKIFKE